jgi:phosphate:Na+ symporter
LPQVVAYLRGDAVSAFLLAACFTWLLHSSIAAMLLLGAFAAEGVLPFEVALPMVLGANLGGGLIAVWLTRGQARVARRIPLGNLLFRLVAALAAMVVVTRFAIPLEFAGTTEATQLVNAHVAFNLALVVVSLPLVRPMEKLVALLLPDDPATVEVHVQRPPSALEKNLVGTPRLALPSATRECLRMGETIETMFRPVMDLFESGSRHQVERIRQLDADVNRAHTDIKLFIAEVNRGELTQDEARRGIELTDFAINMEHVGDLIAKTLLPLVHEMREKKLVFSGEGWQEMTSLHARVLANIQLSLNVLVSGDIDSARQLMQEKEIIRKLERESHERHLRRLQTGQVESIETSDVHLEVVRAFKEINSLLVTVAHPILSNSGELLGSRLVATNDTQSLKSQSPNPSLQI